MASWRHMEDQRLTKRLTEYWNRLRKDLPLPAWAKFNVGSLQDVWGQCCVWRVDLTGLENKRRQYTYEYMGSNAREALGQDLTGMVFISHFQRFPGARVVERVEEVVASHAPVSDEGSFVNENQKIVKYRSCLLPFGTPEGKVTHIVLGLSWKAF